MKKLFLSLALIGGISVASAQELPQSSPAAKVEQRVGLTDISIEYSRPSTKGRVIFGGLVPYGKLWRTGANMNTTIEVTTPVKIQGNTLEPGKYSVFTIPEQEMWMVIFNRKTDHPGTSGYTDANDIFRVEARVQKLSEPIETFTIGVNNIKEESAQLVFEWENTRASLPIEVDVFPIAKENIAVALDKAEEIDKWKVYRNAANYYHNSDIDADIALEYIDLSLEGNDKSWYSHWLKAEILASKKEYKAATKVAKQAKKVGEDEAKETGKEFHYAEMVDKGIEEWKAMK